LCSASTAPAQSEDEKGGGRGKKEEVKRRLELLPSSKNKEGKRREKGRGISSFYRLSFIIRKEGGGEKGSFIAGAGGGDHFLCRAQIHDFGRERRRKKGEG